MHIVGNNAKKKPENLLEVLTTRHKHGKRWIKLSTHGRIKAASIT